VTAYAVKHVYEERGSLVRAIQDFNNIPHSYTSKKKEAEDAARGNAIYVIEVSKDKLKTIYRLGYKFISTNKCERAGGALWEGVWKYKNTVVYPNPVNGCFFDSPVLIDSPKLDEWLRGKARGMLLIPEDLIDELEKIILNPINMAKQFKT